jgi:tRNA pseudouridine38-40 synthase
MRNICLIVSYDGTNYHGWQCQPDLITVEQTLREKIEKITDHPVKIYGGARTDSGVHAYGQVVNFFTESTIGLHGLVKGLNSLLPVDIRVHDAREVAVDFHARYSTKSKVYVYAILNSLYNSPFYARYAWHIPYPIDVQSMHRAAKSLAGTHDFSAFKKKNEVYRSHERTVIRAGAKRRGNMTYVLVEGTGFLRYMVRNIVGTLVLVGSGRLSADDFRSILESRDRDEAGPTAPAKGLFLREIKY